MNKNILYYKILKPNKAFKKNVFYVFIHGFMFTDIWERTGFINYFRDYQCVLIDSLGFGSSVKPHNIEYTIKDHIDYMYNTISYIIANVENPILYGISYSTGTVILVNLMSHYKLPWCKCSIISSAFFMKTDNIGKELQTFFKLSQTNGFDDFFNMSRFIIDLLGNNLSLFNYRILDSKYFVEFKKNDPIAAKKTFFNLLYCPHWDIDKTLSNINKKILCIHPTHDEFISFDIIEKLCCKYNHIFKLISWENNHFIDQKNCKFLTDTIIDFFKC